VRTTGHTPTADGGRDFLGKPMDLADGVYKCLFCHTTNPRSVLESAGPELRRSTREGLSPGCSTEGRGNGDFGLIGLPPKRS
jgi:hypothetical protein